MTAEFTADWLALREPADAEARNRSLVAMLLERVRAPLVVHDLGSGTGANRRWLDPALPKPQQWVLHEQDPDLVARAEHSDADVRVGDFMMLRPEDLLGASLVTASAVLDILTKPQLERLTHTIAAAAVPALFVLTVSGRVQLTPSHPLDSAVSEAFNRHQHRNGRCGPDAVAVVAAAFRAVGYQVHLAPSPWRLGPHHRELTEQWLRGWCAAAADEDPHLELDDYVRSRLDDCVAGRLRVVVHHNDLLALPGNRP
jgi:hypothetical protein